MIIRQLTVFTVLMFLMACTQTVETEFGITCSFSELKPERKAFSSQIDGSLKFIMDESSDKISGKVFSGSIQSVSEGITSLIFPNESVIENCKDCIFLFVRKDGGQSATYRAESANIDVTKLYYDTKGRVSFMKGSFKRLVFKNIEIEECIAIERVDFVFY